VRVRAIRVRCQKPGCDQRTTLGVHHLLAFDETGPVGRDAQGWVVASMVEIGGWAFGLDQEGVLYGICPADAAIYSLKKGPPGSGA
jgi:hypothetical protein